MSTGRVHTRASIMLAGGFLFEAFLIKEWSMLWFGLGALLGIMISPDLDVDNGNVSHTILRKGIGQYPEMIWRILWKGYSASLKHGSFLSHFPIISTIGRLAYLFFWLIMLPMAFMKWVYPEMNFWYEVSRWGWRVVDSREIIMGLMGSDIIHWGLDILTTEHKTKSPDKQKIVRTQ